MNDEELHKAQESQRTYSRRPEVESKVRYLLSLRPAQREREVLMLCGTVVPGHKYPPGILEVLVWAVRHGCRRVSKAHDEAASRIYAISGVFLRAKVRKFAYTNVEAERIVEETLTSLMEHLLSDDAKLSFWECQFLRCLSYRFETISSKSQVRRGISTAASIDEQDAQELSDVSISVEDLAMLRTIMAELSDEERNVLTLKCVDQLPEESADLSVDSIARRIGKTGRTVRNILMRIRDRYMEEEN